MKTSDFNFELPAKLIAQNPLTPRDHARLMVLHRDTQTIEHRHIYDLPKILGENDVLVFNETQVFPARLYGKIKDKDVEILLHKEITPNRWECLVKPGKRFKIGSAIIFNKDLRATVITINEDGSRILEFSESGKRLEEKIDELGETPLPPYIQHSTSNPKQYQTIFAKHRGSVAAPTAGLHFTSQLLETLKEKGVKEHFVTLHVGRGTFEPVKVEDISKHKMHHEWLELNKNTANKLNQAKTEGKRIISVGTTTTRTLEACAQNNILTPQTKETDLFITPGYEFQFIDAMLTNFHLPQSTLLMLISALAGKDFIMKAYQEAITKKYRFYSFGDAMLIL